MEMDVIKNFAVVMSAIIKRVDCKCRDCVQTTFLDVRDTLRYQCLRYQDLIVQYLV